MRPLAGVRALELAGLGPAPFGCMVLADLGADVVRVQRPGGSALDVPDDPLTRSRRILEADLKDPAALALIQRLADRADVLVEGFRPGVAERLGLGPADLQARNPALVYARMTGWGQTGPLAQAAGHDINYLAISGLLHDLGPAGQPPAPPMNLVADFGGGGMLLAVGVLAALVERSRTGRGGVVDAAMVDGAAQLGAFLAGFRGSGRWPAPRGENLLDGGAPFYRTYEAADGGFLAVGALEPQFYAALLSGLGLAADALPDRDDPASWPELHERFASTFAGRSRDAWVERFAGLDACVSPVLGPDEAPVHPHNAARGTFTKLAGVAQPAPAPLFDGTRAPVSRGPQDGTSWADWGVTDDELATLRRSGSGTSAP